MKEFIKKIFVITFLSKKVFFKPKKKRYILFNKGSEVLIFLIKKNFQILPTLQQEVNLYILFKIFLKFKFTSLDYYKEYILIIQPKTIITFIDNDLIFYRIKFFFKNIFFISIQNGIRGELVGSGIYKNNLFCDLVCLIGKLEKKFYKYLKTRISIVGSVLNNETYKKFNKLEDKKKIISFISQYRIHKNLLFLDAKEKKFNNEYYDNERILLPIIADYSERNNYKLIIIGVYFNNSNENQQEYNFYKSILNKFVNLKWSLLPKKNFFSNYHFLNKPLLIVSFESTLGLEALARGIKLFRFQRRILNSSQNFWVYNKKKSKYFSRNFDKKEVFKKFDKILSINKCSTSKYYNNIKLSSLIKFDPSNVSLKKIISKLN